MIILLEVKDTKLTLVNPKSLIGTQVNYDTCKFNFGEEWNGFVKTAVFKTESQTIPMVLDANDTCEVPWVQTENAGILYIGVFGIKEDVEIPTNFVTLRVIEGSAGDNAPPPPTIDVYMQIIEQLRQTTDHVDSVIESILTEEEVRQLAELERQQAEVKRGQDYLLSEAERHRLYGEAEIIRDNFYGQAENNRDDKYNEAELSRNNLYSEAETNRDNEYLQVEVTRDNKYEQAEQNRDSQFAQAESDRETTFNELIDSQVIQSDIQQKLIELEQNYAPEIVSVREQINNLDAELDAIVANVTVDSEIILARGEETTLGVRLDKQASELSNIATQTDEHLESAMPHEFTNLKTGKKYRYGRQVSADGIPQIISEEVV